MSEFRLECTDDVIEELAACGTVGLCVNRKTALARRWFAASGDRPSPLGVVGIITKSGRLGSCFDQLLKPAPGPLEVVQRHRFETKKRAGTSAGS